MQELFTYLLKSSGLIIAFFLAYHFLLHKETFFNSNRWFLLLGLVTSTLLPLFFIKRIVVIEQPKIAINNLISNSNDSISKLPEIKQEIATIDWYQIIAIGYGIIAFILLLKVVVNLFSLSKLLQNKQIKKQEQFTFVDLQEDIAPFSFFNYIVFNSSLYSDNELENILLHEKIHSKEKHSFDVLLANLFTIVFWFNPIVWFYKKAIVQNLEYIADNKAIQLIEDKKSYQKALLKVVSHQNCLPITNHFYQSLIKKRIVMLNKNQSKKRNSWKYAVVLPALIGFVLLFQIKVVAQEKFIELEDTSQKEIATTPNTTSDFSSEEIGYVFDKISSDKELKMNIEDLKKTYNIDLIISNLKRNNNGEITTIKLNFDDNKGKKGTTEQNRNIPIRPIFFKVDITQNNTTKTGFYNNSEMIEKPNDNELENRISTIESIAENAEIYVDEIRFSKEDILELDPKSLIKIDVLNDKKSLEKYKAKSKEIVVIKTNWIKPKPIEVQEKNMLYIINGKEYFQKDVKGFTYKCDGSITHLVGKEAIEKYGTKGKDGVLVFNGNTVAEPNLDQENKTIIITVDNGEKILFMNNKNSVKIPGNPAAQIDNTLILIINGEVQKNAKNSIDNLNLDKIKTIKIEEEKDNSGTPIKKMIITTK